MTAKQLQTLMQTRVFACMLVQFMAFFTSGLSLLLLTARLHWPFTVVAGFLGVLTIILSAYQLHTIFGWKWARHVEWYHPISGILCTSALAFDVVTPSKTTWFTYAAFGATLAAHMFFALFKHLVKPKIALPPQAVGAFFLSLVWAGCAVTTLIMSAQSVGWARINTYIVCALSGAEAVLLAVTGFLHANELILERRRPGDTGQDKISASHPKPASA